jgi:hypothetical protein
MSDFEVSEEGLSWAIELFVEKGMLHPVGHGFCWICSTEKAVYDFSTEYFPVQEPKCQDCIINTAMTALKFRDIREKVFGEPGHEHEDPKGT